MKILRARGQYLYDENGMQYLDCISNVQHGKDILKLCYACLLCVFSCVIQFKKCIYIDSLLTSKNSQKAFIK